MGVLLAKHGGVFVETRYSTWRTPASMSTPPSLREKTEQAPAQTLNLTSTKKYFYSSNTQKVCKTTLLNNGLTDQLEENSF